jgi:hypothetical protein
MPDSSAQQIYLVSLILAFTLLGCSAPDTTAAGPACGNVCAILVRLIFVEICLQLV